MVLFVVYLFCLQCSFCIERSSMVRRKDNKGRVLNDGETQGKDGRYRYQYTNMLGERKAIYSWKLLPSDKTPSGKRKDLSLREKEKQIAEDLSSGIVPCGGNMTVLELVEKYISQKTGVRHNTRANYNFVINIIKKEEFGAKRIDKVKLSDAKAWLIKLQADGRGYSSIHSIRGVVRPAFQMAVDDDLLLKNPFEFQLATVVVNDSVTREAITRKQERQFLEFIKNDKHFCKYYEGIFILFNTGMRISEFVGLTVSDIDFDSRKITIDHQLQRTRDMQYVIEDTKTLCGTREIPMADEVYECFKKIIKNRKKPKIEPMVGGRSGFLYLDKNNMPMVALHWEKYFQHIREKYNRIYKVQMPKVTPHVCRHTFCSNMAKSGMNPKTLQYIMGHSDIGVTLNTYTHVQYEDAKKEMSEICELKLKRISAM
ncbi:MAG: site-specific integrase [Eubacterium sp.]|nr:site-specific integrase [Eubacterium sp.]